MHRRPRFRALLLLAVVAEAGCYLDRRGLGPPGVTPGVAEHEEPHFGGCFRHGTSPRFSQILIVQHTNDLLEGTGFGVFAGTTFGPFEGAQGWSFTGRVTASRASSLFVTIAPSTPNPPGPLFIVDATLSEDGDSLTLDKPSFPRAHLELQRCVGI